ncbi:MAG: hypothetical protein ACLFQK_09850 [Fibrobacterota bacterium]
MKYLMIALFAAVSIFAQTDDAVQTQVKDGDLNQIQQMFAGEIPEDVALQLQAAKEEAAAVMNQYKGATDAEKEAAMEQLKVQAQEKLQEALESVPEQKREKIQEALNEIIGKANERRGEAEEALKEKSCQ